MNMTPQSEEQIPTVVISTEQHEAKLQCVICLEHFKKKEHVRQLACQHIFHGQCITPWLQQQPTCPSCRTTAIQRSHVNPEDLGIISPLTLAAFEQPRLPIVLLRRLPNSHGDIELFGASSSSSDSTSLRHEDLLNIVEEDLLFQDHDYIRISRLIENIDDSESNTDVYDHSVEIEISSCSNHSDIDYNSDVDSNEDEDNSTLQQTVMVDNWYSDLNDYAPSESGGVENVSSMDQSEVEDNSLLDNSEFHNLDLSQYHLPHTILDVDNSALNEMEDHNEGGDTTHSGYIHMENNSDSDGYTLEIHAMRDYSDVRDNTHSGHSQIGDNSHSGGDNLDINAMDDYSDVDENRHSDHSQMEDHSCSDGDISEVNYMEDYSDVGENSHSGHSENEDNSDGDNSESNEMGDYSEVGNNSHSGHSQAEDNSNSDGDNSEANKMEDYSDAGNNSYSHHSQQEDNSHSDGDNSEVNEMEDYSEVGNNSHSGHCQEEDNSHSDGDNSEVNEMEDYSDVGDNTHLDHSQEEDNSHSDGDNSEVNEMEGYSDVEDSTHSDHSQEEDDSHSDGDNSEVNEMEDYSDLEDSTHSDHSQEEDNSHSDGDNSEVNEKEDYSDVGDNTHSDNSQEEDNSHSDGDNSEVNEMKDYCYTVSYTTNPNEVKDGSLSVYSRDDNYLHPDHSGVAYNRNTEVNVRELKDWKKKSQSFVSKMLDKMSLTFDNFERCSVSWRNHYLNSKVPHLESKSLQNFNSSLIVSTNVNKIELNYSGSTVHCHKNVHEPVAVKMSTNHVKSRVIRCPRKGMKSRSRIGSKLRSNNQTYSSGKRKTIVNNDTKVLYPEIKLKSDKSIGESLGSKLFEVNPRSCKYYVKDIPKRNVFVVEKRKMEKSTLTLKNKKQRLN